MSTALKAARERIGKTQAQVASEASVAVRLYQYYEAGQKTPSVTTALRIARSLGTTAEALFGEAEKPPAP